MASTTFVDTVTEIPAAWANDVNTLVYNVFGAAQNAAQALSALGLTNAASYNPNNVALTGGSIDNVTIGGNMVAPLVAARNMTVTTAPVNPTDVVNLSYLQSYVPQQVTTSVNTLKASLGTLAYENSNNVTITGGVINNTEIGLNGAASGQFVSLQVSNPPVQSTDVVTLGYMMAHYDAAFANFGGMATQNPNTVIITGGTIDGVSIGSITPATGIFNTLAVNQLPVSPSQVANKQYVDTQIATVGGNAGTMSTQNANAVTITGGTINGVTIGGSNPSPGTFTAATVTGTQAILKAQYNSAASNFGGLNISENATTILSLYAYGENNVNANTATLTSSVPFNIAVGTTNLTINSAATTLSSVMSIANGATAVYGVQQIASLTLGDQTSHAGGVMFYDGATTTNWGSITYQKSSVTFEVASPQTVGLNSSTNGPVLACGGTGEFSIGTLGSALTYDINKLVVYGGIDAAQGVIAPVLRRSVNSLGAISGTVALTTNQTDAFTFSLSGAATLQIDPVDSRFGSNSYLREVTLVINMTAVYALTVKAPTGGAINGAASITFNTLTTGWHVYKMYSFDNGNTWLMNTAAVSPSTT